MTTTKKTTAARTAEEISGALNTSQDAVTQHHANATDLLVELVTSRYPDVTGISAEFPWYLDGGANEDDEWRVCHLELPGYSSIGREYDGGISSGNHDGPDQFGEFTEDEMRLMDTLAKEARKDPRWRHSRGRHDELASMRLSIAS